MDLQNILDTKRENEGGYNSFVMEQINNSTDNRVDNPIPNVGDDAIEFALPKEDGKEVCLADLIKNGPVILNFFRGNFCEFCQLELKAMQRSFLEFKKHNATMVGISPSFVSVKTLAEEGAYSYSYSILSDIGNKVAASYGLRYKVSDELANMFMAFGMSLEEVFGENEENTLSIPATFVVSTENKIVFKFANSDYTKRAEPADIIAALISISNK